MTLQLPKLETDVITGVGTMDEDAIAIKLEGTADTESRSELEAFICQAHVEAVRLRVPHVIVDLRELEFMNASSLKVFVMWLAQMNDLGPGNRYKLVFRSNPNLPWQQRGLAALSCFAVDLVTIET